MIALAVTLRCRLVSPGKGIGMDIDIKRSGSQWSDKGPAEYFTGSTGWTRCFRRPRVSGASVAFEPGARAGSDPETFDQSSHAITIDG